MASRRDFLKTSTAVTLGSAVATLAEEAEETAMFRFGLMADCQYVDAENRGRRHYRKSPEKLREAVAFFNQHELSCVLHLGDFIDRDFASFDMLLPITKKLKAPLHHALGNHDFDLPDPDKAKVLAKLELERGYYRFVQHGVRFIVLDTTEHSTYRHPEGSPEQALAKRELATLMETGSGNAVPWNSRPSDAQITWLTDELVAATKAGESVLLFGHHPIRPEGGLTMWQDDKLLKLLQQHPCVKTYINGHHHAGAYVDQHGLHFLTLNGMVEQESNAYALVDVFKDRLELTGFGRQASRVMRFRPTD